MSSLYVILLYVVYFWSGTIQKYFKKIIQNFSFSTKLIKAHLKTIKFLSMKGQRYTEFAKGFLKACQYFGISAYRVSKEFDIPKSTACRLYKELKNVKLEDNLYKKQKPAHMKLEDLHKRGVRNILRAVKKNPKITIDKLCTLLIPGQTVSRNVIRRILRRNRFKFRVPSSRPYLKKKHKKNAVCGPKLIKITLLLTGPQLYGQTKVILRSVSRQESNPNGFKIAPKEMEKA